MKRFVLISIQMLVLFFHALSQDYRIDICTDYTTLSAPPLHSGETGHWADMTGTAIFEYPEKSVTQVKNILQGENLFQWKVSKNGTTSITEFVVLNNSFTVDAGEDIYFDTYERHIHLNAGEFPDNDTKRYSGLWRVINGVGGFDVDWLNKTYVRGAGFGINTYRWTVTDSKTGCIAFDDVELRNAYFEVDAGKDQFTCENSTVLNANKPLGGKGNWTIVDGGGIIADINNYRTKITQIPPGKSKYKWTINYNGVERSDTVEIMNTSFSTSAGIDVVTCENNYFLNADEPYKGLTDTIGINATGIWKILGDGMQKMQEEDIHNPNAQVYGLAEGINSFIWEVYREYNLSRWICADNDVVEIFKPYKPKAQIQTDKLFGCGPLEVSFQGDSEYKKGEYSYEWDFGDKSNVSNEQNPVHTYKVSSLTTFTVRLIVTENICHQSDTAFLYIEVAP